MIRFRVDDDGDDARAVSVEPAAQDGRGAVVEASIADVAAGVPLLDFSASGMRRPPTRAPSRPPVLSAARPSGGDPRGRHEGEHAVVRSVGAGREDGVQSEFAQERYY